ncbi:MAG: TRAP transporter small permease subunit [Burkholderiaceae bacterium]|nr:MAG: TRAP transporter small permease subunit [Burkholderiaceae bacterium]
MHALLAFCRAVDWITERIGRAVGWLLLAAVVISAGNAVIRKAFSMSSNAFLEAQWYLFAAVFLLGAGYVFLHDQHVRIDVVAGRLSRRVQVAIDVVGILFFLLPLCVFIVWTALPSVATAYDSGEISANPGGLIRWPLYVLVPVGFVLLALQSMSELFKRVAFLAGAGPDPHARPEKTDEERLLEELQREQALRERGTAGGSAR